MPTRLRRRPTTSWLLAAGALLLTLTACSGGSGPAAAASVTPTTGTTGGAVRFDPAALQPFRDCMSTNGSPLPTFAPRGTRSPRPSDGGTGGSQGGGFGGGGFGGGGFGRGGGGLAGVDTSTDPVVMKAYAACKAKLPAGFAEAQQQNQQERAAFTSCMKDHGVVLPTAAPSAGQSAPAVDRTTTTYKAANAICGALLPQRAPSSASSTSAAG